MALAPIVELAVPPMTLTKPTADVVVKPCPSLMWLSSLPTQRSLFRVHAVADKGQQLPDTSSSSFLMQMQHRADVARAAVGSRSARSRLRAPPAALSPIPFVTRDEETEGVGAGVGAGVGGAAAAASGAGADTARASPSRVSTAAGGSRFASSSASAQVHAEAARKEAYRKDQLRKKVRRVLRQCIRMAMQDASTTGGVARAAVAAAGTWQGEAAMARLARVALETHRIADALVQSELLSDLGELELLMMASSGKRRRQARYSTLYTEGSPASCFFVLTSGTLIETISTEREAKRHTVERKPGHAFFLFGMESMLGRRRKSTLRAESDAEVVRFAAAELNIQNDGAVKVNARHQ